MSEWIVISHRLNKEDIFLPLSCVYLIFSFRLSESPSSLIASSYNLYIYRFLIPYNICIQLYSIANCLCGLMSLNSEVFNVYVQLFLFPVRNYLCVRQQDRIKWIYFSHARWPVSLLLWIYDPQNIEITDLRPLPETYFKYGHYVSL